MGPLLPSCTCTLRIGQVLADSCTDGLDILFAGFDLCTSQSRFERFLRVASATGKVSLIGALIGLMKSCRVGCSKTEPKQQVEQEHDVDRINK